MRVYVIALGALLTACSQASPVMEATDGTYFVSTRAAPAAGGTAGAYTRAHEEAVKFCAAKGGRPLLVSSQDRDVYQSAYGGAFSGTPRGGYSGGFGGGTNAWGSANMQFRCG